VNVVDLNLLMYAHDELSPFHRAARTWFESIMSTRQPVGFPVPVVAGFIRITTDRRLGGGRFRLSEAIAVVDEWLSLPHARLLLPTDRHWEVLRSVLADSNASGKLTTDAQIAAITLEYGGTLFSADRDFARFEGLRWQNPLRDA
jgi:hypothetical protein